MQDQAFLCGEKYRRIAHRRAIHKQVTVLLIGFTMGILLGDALGRQAARRQYLGQLQRAEQQVAVLEQRVQAIFTALGQRGPIKGKP